MNIISRPSANTAFSELVSPESVGMSSARLERLRAKLRWHVDTKRISGISVGVARHGKPVFREVYGVQNVEKNRPVTDDTLFRLYSMTKPLTAFTMMVLYEEGHFQLFDPVHTFLPEFKDAQVLKGFDNGKPITEPPSRSMQLYDLFTHIAGLGSPVRFPKELKFNRESVLNLNQSMEVGIRNLAKLPLVAHPGTQFSYGFSHDVMGRIIEVITGKRLDVAMREKLLDPLGMHDTVFKVPAEKAHHLAEVYGRFPEGLKNVTQAVPQEADYLNLDSPMFSGGGGMVSTASDIFRLTQMLLNGGEFNGVRVFSPLTVEYMMMDHMPKHIPSMKELAKGNIIWERALGGFRMNMFFGTVVDVHDRAALDMAGVFGYGGLAGTMSFGDPRTGIAGVKMEQDISPDLSWRLSDEVKVLTYQAIVKL